MSVEMEIAGYDFFYTQCREEEGEGRLNKGGSMNLTSPSTFFSLFFFSFIIFTRLLFSACFEYIWCSFTKNDVHHHQISTTFKYLIIWLTLPKLSNIVVK